MSENMTTLETLHVYEYDCDWVVARDQADADEILRQHYVSILGDVENAEDGAEMAEDATLKIWCRKDTGEVWEPHASEAELIEKTAGEWARERGRGWLCGTEY